MTDKILAVMANRVMTAKEIASMAGLSESRARELLNAGVADG